MIHNLVLSGGGLSGLIFFGILKALEENNTINISEIKKFAGTSIGSIISFLLSLNFSCDEIIEEIVELDFNKMKNISLLNFIHYFGFDNNINLINFICKLLLKKNISKNITFLELYKKYKKELYIITTNLTKSKREIFSYKTYPDTSILIAIKMSICIPILFIPIKYNNNIYLDGFLSNSFPIDIFKDEPNNTIGLNIVHSYEKNNTNNIYDYILSIFKLNLEINEKNYMKKHRKIFPYIYNIPISSKNTINYNMSNDIKKKIIDDGYFFINKKIL